MNEAVAGWISVVLGCGLALVVFAIVTNVIDVIHAWAAKGLMVLPAWLFRWDCSQFQPEGTWWTCVLAQIALRVAAWPLGVSNHDREPLSFAVLVVMLFGCGYSAVQNGSWLQRVASGVASLLALSLFVVAVALVGAVVLAIGGWAS